MKEARLINRISEKILNCSRQMSHFGPENSTSHNSGLALRIFLKFYRMKGANRYMKTLLVVF